MGIKSVISVPSVARSFFPERSLATEITEAIEVRIERLIALKCMPGLL